MSGVEVFDVTFSNVEDTYYAGQKVEGHCTVELTEPLSVKSVTVHVRGQAVVSWPDRTQMDSSNKDYLRREARVRYVSHTLSLLPRHARTTNASDDVSTLLPAGRHSLPFSLPLPPTCPSSLAGRYGQVSYWTQAVLSRPRGADLQVSKEFKVIGLMDLNHHPQAECPAVCERQEWLCVACCRSGPVSLTLRLLRSGHVAGESLQFTARVHNLSSRALDCCSLYLEKKTTFTIDSDQNHCREKLCRITTGPIDQGEQLNWTGSPDKLVIPPGLQPTGMPGCNLIDISYAVKMCVYPACSTKVGVSLPLVIGTIPSRYALTGDPPRPCRPLQMTPRVGYPAIPPPGFGLDGVGRMVPSAPEPETSDRTQAEGPVPPEGPESSGGWESSSAESGAGATTPLSGAGPSALVAGAGHLTTSKSAELPVPGSSEDIVGEPPPSYEECVEGGAGQRGGPGMP